MAKRTASDVGDVPFETVSDQFPATLPLKERTLSASNERKFDAAMKHLRKMFEEAESEQIDGRKFYGFTEIRVPWEGGNAMEIRASRFAQDRVVRDGR